MNHEAFVYCKPRRWKKSCSAEVYARAAGIFTNRNDEFDFYVTKAPMDAADAVRRAAGVEELRGLFLRW